MPAEWEKQKGIWLQWPHEDASRGYQRKLEAMWLEMTETLKQQGMVYICVQDVARMEHIDKQLLFYGIDWKNIEYHIIPTNDVWGRDNGPTFIVNKEGELAIINWQFNGWGGRYPYDLDNKASRQIAQKLRIPVFETDLTTEGGKILK